jgi:hypothetical protein
MASEGLHGIEALVDAVDVDERAEQPRVEELLPEPRDGRVE